MEDYKTEMRKKKAELEERKARKEITTKKARLLLQGHHKLLTKVFNKKGSMMDI